MDGKRLKIYRIDVLSENNFPTVIHWLFSSVLKSVVCHQNFRNFTYNTSVEFRNVTGY